MIGLLSSLEFRNSERDTVLETIFLHRLYNNPFIQLLSITRHLPGEPKIFVNKIVEDFKLLIRLMRSVAFPQKTRPYSSLGTKGKDEGGGLLHDRERVYSLADHEDPESRSRLRAARG